MVVGASLEGMGAQWGLPVDMQGAGAVPVGIARVRLGPGSGVSARAGTPGRGVGSRDW